ncbi:HTH-type transcriptional regulator DmlR [compost metagenome]
MFDLNDIAIFIQIVDAGSFAGAARRMGVPANTLSRRIKQLEQYMGARLFHRSTRKLSLTDAGHSLYGQSATQINTLSEVSRQLLAGSGEPTGRIRIAAPSDFFEIFQMDFVADFLSRYPKIHLDFALSDQRVDLIAEGMDLAFRAGIMPDSSLVARKINTGRRILAASQTYLDTYGIPIDIYALTHHLCILAPNVSGQSTWHLDGPLGAAQIVISGRFSASTAQAQLKAAINGLGICFLPEPILRSSLKGGALVEVLADYDQQNNDLFIVYPSRNHIPLAVRTFLDEAVAHLQGELLE